MARRGSGDRRRGAGGSSRRGGRGREDEGRGGLFGRRKPRDSGRSRRGRGIDFGAVDDSDDLDDDDRYDDDDSAYDRRDRESRQRPERSRRRRPRQQRLTLMNLCTPVFGYAAVLPHDPQDPQPPYRQFRDGVVNALRRIETEAPQHGIESSDAAQACYALCFFMDTAVASSTWNGAGEWATEPLGIVMQKDPEGGDNFYRRLEGFGDREADVKEVFLVCMALGFRGKLAELEPNEQAAKVAEIRQHHVRTILRESLDKQPELFPEAYREAESIEDEVPKPPGWWLGASLGVVAVVLLAWVGLWIWAGKTPADAQHAVQQVLAAGADAGRPAPAANDGTGAP